MDTLLRRTKCWVPMVSIIEGFHCTCRCLCGQLSSTWCSSFDLGRKGSGGGDIGKFQSSTCVHVCMCVSLYIHMYINLYLCVCVTISVQGNLSNTGTHGTKILVLISEVSLFQDTSLIRIKCIYIKLGFGQVS